MAIAKLIWDFESASSARAACRTGTVGYGRPSRLSAPRVIPFPKYVAAADWQGSRPRQGATSSPPTGEALQGVRVLLVEDDYDSRELMEAVLEGWGCSVVSAESTADAFAALEREQPDIILSDIGLPVEDGYAFVRKLRSFDEAQGGSLPAVAVTAFASDADRLEASDVGFNGHVQKPVNFVVLFNTVARLLGRLP